MGIIRAGIDAVKTTSRDQWIDAIRADRMDSSTIMTRGVYVTDKGKQRFAAKSDVITDGSLIYVEENQMMLLVDGGKIIDYSAEPGYFQVSNENAPSLFNGDFKGALSDAYNRFRFGGSTPYTQEVYYINTQEIKDIPFGTTNPINYFDNFYNAELYLRAHGYYSLRIVNPIKFFAEIVSRSSERMEIEDMRKLFLAEFLTAFQTAIGKMSVEGQRISHISSRSSELAEHMSQVLDNDWEERRGMRIESVGIASISYDDESRELINIRNKGAMLSDDGVRTGYVQGAAARGVEAAGSNPSGATSGFMGFNMGMNSAGSFINSTNQTQSTKPQQAESSKTDADSWTCTKCSHVNSGGKFCNNCGTARPKLKHCTNCGAEVQPGVNFCGNCGHKIN